MEILRTPDERFKNLKGYPFEPHYTVIQTHDNSDLRIWRRSPARASRRVGTVAVPEPVTAAPGRRLVRWPIGRGMGTAVWWPRHLNWPTEHRALAPFAGNSVTGHSPRHPCECSNMPPASQRWFGRPRRRQTQWPHAGNQPICFISSVMCPRFYLVQLECVGGPWAGFRA